MRKFSKIAYAVAVILTLLFSYSCNRRVAPKSAKVDKTRKIKCRCSNNKFPRNHYQPANTDFEQ